jgi:hypothetical protein
MSRLFRRVDMFSGFDFDRKYTRKQYDNNWGALNTPKKTAKTTNEFGETEFKFAKNHNDGIPSAMRRNSDDSADTESGDDYDFTSSSDEGDDSH